MQAKSERWPVTDFCLAPETVERVARQGELMDGMLRWLGITPDASSASQARLRCVDCGWSRRCAHFLAAPTTAKEKGAPTFCANALFFQDCSGEKTTMPNLQGGSP
jgi:hypothetical protein